MPWLSYEDGIWIGLCLLLTEAAKRALRPRERWVPLIPLGLGLLLGLAVAALEEWSGTREYLRAALTHWAMIGPGSMATYKVWRTTITDAGGGKDASTRGH